MTIAIKSKKLLLKTASKNILNSVESTLRLGNLEVFLEYCIDFTKIQEKN